MSEQSNAPETGVEQTSTTEQAVTEPKPTETVEFWKAKAREQEKRAKNCHYSKAQPQAKPQ